MLGLLTLTAIPTVIGVSQGVSQQRAENASKADEKRMAKFYVEAQCESSSTRAREVRGKRVVLRDGKAYLSSSSNKPSYTLCAFYIEYPDEERKPAPLGLVSQVADDPPMLNWIYVDKNTMELKHGNRSQSREHHVGPWDWTEEDQIGLTFEGWEGFVAVQDDVGEWQLFFDRNDDGLKDFVGKKRRKLEVTLERIMCDNEKKD
ncbi:hypothetical protein GJ744_005556 [Endocarpon pusillum]|uniref:Uncharacterized protein n=1 Tax=Endocarpon pusillum TaxID=364733 RepID=A0A8H7ATT5_9EURO|nr:hypothetical protein GJ744_005556 [Endocarpon pusillum]